MLNFQENYLFTHVELVIFLTYSLIRNLIYIFEFYVRDHLILVIHLLSRKYFFSLWIYYNSFQKSSIESSRSKRELISLSSLNENRAISFVLILIPLLKLFPELKFLHTVFITSIRVNFFYNSNDQFIKNKYSNKIILTTDNEYVNKTNDFVYILQFYTLNLHLLIVFVFFFFF